MEFMVRLANALNDSSLKFDVRKASALEKEKHAFSVLVKKTFNNVKLHTLAREYHLILCDQHQWMLKFINKECSANLAHEQWLSDTKDRLSILRTLYIDHINLIPEYLLEKLNSLPELECKLEMMENVQTSLSKFFNESLSAIDSIGNFSQIEFYNDTEHDFNLMLFLEFSSADGKPIKLQQYEYKGIHSKQFSRLGFSTDFQWDSVLIDWLFSFENVPEKD